MDNNCCVEGVDDGDTETKQTKGQLPSTDEGTSKKGKKKRNKSRGGKKKNKNGSSGTESSLLLLFHPSFHRFWGAKEVFVWIIIFITFHCNPCTFDQWPNDDSQLQVLFLCS